MFAIKREENEAYLEGLPVVDTAGGILIARIRRTRFEGLGGMVFVS